MYGILGNPLVIENPLCATIRLVLSYSIYGSVALMGADTTLSAPQNRETAITRM